MTGVNLAQQQLGARLVGVVRNVVVQIIDRLGDTSLLHEGLGQARQRLRGPRILLKRLLVGLDRLVRRLFGLHDAAELELRESAWIAHLRQDTRLFLGGLHFALEHQRLDEIRRRPPVVG